MPTFKGKGESPSEWRVELDAPLIEEIQEKHGINLANLDGDPLIKLRNDPMKLVAVVYLICQEQIKERELSPQQFAKQLPHVDQQLDAVREAIIGFFPSGRASHIREVLTKYDEMNTKTDEVVISQMNQVLKDPKTIQRLDGKAREEVEKAMNDLFPISSEPGT